jgi:hypothetical protein
MNSDPTTDDPPTRRLIACVDGLLALAIVAFGLMVLRANYGNPDPAAFAIARMMARVFYAPSMLLLGFASLCMWRRWRVRRPVQELAICWLILSLLLTIVFSFRGERRHEAGAALSSGAPGETSGHLGRGERGFPAAP